jgi:hypothetical protein
MIKSVNFRNILQSFRSYDRILFPYILQKAALDLIKTRLVYTSLLPKEKYKCIA